MKLKHILIGLGALIALLVILKLTGVVGGKKVEKVITELVEERSVKETVTASGKVQPETEVKLSSEVSGEVVELHVREGDVVKKGQLLCKVRPDVLQSGYERAAASYNVQKASLAAAQQQLKEQQARFENAEATYKRNVELFNKKVISASEFDGAKATYLAAQATLNNAKENVSGAKFGLEQSGANVKEAGANLAKTTIYAPVDGVVSKLSIELGDRILGTVQMAGTEIMRISNLSVMEVKVDVNENDINRVKLGNDAEIEIDAFSGQKFHGKVTEIASSSTTVGTATSSAEQVTNFAVKVRITQDDDSKKVTFRPGMSATVDITSSVEKGLSVPIQSVFTNNDPSSSGENKDKKENSDGFASTSPDGDKGAAKANKQYVYLYEKNKTVKKVEVQTSVQDDQYIIVKKGLTKGQEVVTGPHSAIQNKLKDGVEVEKTTKDKLFEGSAKK